MVDIRLIALDSCQNCAGNRGKSRAAGRVRPILRIVSAMRFVMGLLRGFLVVGVIAAAIAALWLAFAPPPLLRLGSAYAAKIVCSNVFLAAREPGEVMAVDVQAPGNPLLRLMNADVDDEARTVSVGLFGIFARQVAVARQEGGCVSVPDGDIRAAD